MAHSINAHFLPAVTCPEELAGKTVVVIDVLRATTTIVQALAAGAKEVIPCLEVEEARRLAGACQGPHVLGGERGGRKIEGFDLGNSPEEYTSQAVAGKSVFFTTTNGTRAMLACKQAQRVLVGAFTNLTALRNLLASAEEIELLCAGTDGRITREDVLLAGAICDYFDSQAIANFDDQACLALHAWRGEPNVPLETRLLASRGGRNLRQIGQASDVRLAAQVDTHTIVPKLLLAEWKIVAAKNPSL